MKREAGSECPAWEGLCRPLGRYPSLWATSMVVAPVPPSEHVSCRTTSALGKQMTGCVSALQGYLRSSRPPACPELGGTAACSAGIAAPADSPSRGR